MGAMSVVSAGRGSNEEGVAAAAKCELHLRPLRPSAALVERPGLPWSLPSACSRHAAAGAPAEAYSTCPLRLTCLPGLAEQKN